MTDEELKEAVAKAVKDYSNLCLERTFTEDTWELRQEFPDA